MRNLAIRIVLWLCERFAIVPLDETRKSMGADAVARSERWELFYLEEGGLADMIRQVRAEAFEAAAETPPDRIETLQYWTTSDRVARRLEQKVRAVIAAGRIEASNRNQMDRLTIERPRKSVADY